MSARATLDPWQDCDIGLYDVVPCTPYRNWGGRDDFCEDVHIFLGSLGATC